MKAKLTLSISKEAVAKGKRYAQMYDISISEMVEKYLDNLLIDDDSNSLSFIGCLSETELSSHSYTELKEMYMSEKLKR